MSSHTGTQKKERDRLAGVTDELRGDASDVKKIFDRLQTERSEAWKRYTEDVHRALAKTNADLEKAKARLEVERAKTEQSMREELDEVIAGLQETFQDLRVQVHLGEMDLTDRVTSLRNDAEQAVEKLRAALRTARDRIAERAG